MSLLKRTFTTSAKSARTKCHWATCLAIRPPGRPPFLNRQAGERERSQTTQHMTPMQTGGSALFHCLMFKSFLSKVISAVLPPDKMEALQGVVTSTAEEEAAASRSRLLAKKLIALAGARGAPGLTRAHLDVALETLLQAANNGVWSLAELPPTSSPE